MKFLTLLITIYQKWVSPAFPPRCKYYPSCSNYTLLAIKSHGVKGLLMAAYRFIRCNPWSNGGVDYPKQKVSINQGNSTNLPTNLQGVK